MAIKSDSDAALPGARHGLNFFQEQFLGRYNVEVNRTLPVSLLLLLACPALAKAQEVKFLDISDVQQRTTLRHPPAPPSECDDTGKSCVGGRYGGGMFLDGGPDRRDPQALGAYLLQVVPTDIDPTQPFEAEWRLLNTGLVPIDIPDWPHLSDLQPGDESVEFTYFSIALAVQVEGTQRGTRSVGIVQLYGAADHEGTMLVLKPGEWIRVHAKVKLDNWPRLKSTRVRGAFWLRRNTFQPHPGGSFTKFENLYPNATPTPWIDIRFVRAR